MKYLLTLCVVVLFSLPALTFAADPIVQCGFSGQPACQACHLIQLGQNLLEWFIGIMASVIALVFAIGGMKMVMSGGSEGGVSEAKGMMTNAVIGFVILLSAWLVVDTVLKTVINKEFFGPATTTSEIGPWNNIQCEQPIVYPDLPPNTGRPPVPSLATTGTISSAQITSRLNTVNTYQTTLCTGVSAEVCNSLKAIMAIESAGNPNATSPVGAAGLMQLMPSTAKLLDPATFSGKTDNQIQDMLRSNTDLSMRLGTQLYADLLSRNNNDLTKTYAAYNGGQGANAPSVDCPGQMKWQCVWDSPGCYGTANTNCKTNTGYAETRKYVTNVKAVRCSLAGAGTPGC